jgi:DUF1009 family protein
VLVKFSRPDQDPRFDIPIAGPDTVRTCAACGVAVISLEAGRTLLLDREQTVSLADQESVALCGHPCGTPLGLRQTQGNA